MMTHDLNVLVVFGTDTGNTELVAEKIRDELALQTIKAELVNVTDLSIEQLGNASLLIMGIPTWDFGGIQMDWEDFGDTLENLNLSGKVVALYGLGDQFGYGDYFVDAMGWLYEKLDNTGARFIGSWSAEGYDFTASRAINDTGTRFCGLAIDEDQQFTLTDERVSRWVNQILTEYRTVYGGRDAGVVA